MIIFCTERFKADFTKLAKHKSYNQLEKEIIDHFFNCSDEQILIGSTILSNSHFKVVKKRLGGRSGFRAYFYIYINDNKLYLGYIYPKTGSEGLISLNKKFQKMIIGEIAEAIRSQNFFEIIVVKEQLQFVSQK